MKFIQDIDGNFTRADKIIALKVSKLQSLTLWVKKVTRHADSN